MNFLNSHLLKLKFLILFLPALAFSGCVSRPIYYWGVYEDNLYTQYQSPQNATPEKQIASMRADIHRANGKPMPPGFYAHLGYQYLLVGRALEARNCFNAEKKAFPESAVLMDRFIAKLK